ncbi:lipase [Gordonia sp. CPCC 206044]
MSPNPSTRRRPLLRAAIPSFALAAALMTVGSVTTPPAQAAPTTQTSPGGRPGTVFASRDLPRDRLAPMAATGDSFTYWTTGTDGTPRLSAGTVQVPKGAAPRAGWPVIVWAHGARGIADRCAPSVRPVTADTRAARRWVERGYAVITPDYAGLGTPGTPQYFDTATTARNIVDAVRAGRDVAAHLSRRWAVVGETQGAAAAVELARQATRLQGPSLDYRGSVASSVPVEFDSLMGGLGPSTGSMPSGVTAEVLYTLSALRNARPSIGLDSYLTDTGVTWLNRAASLCADDLTPEVAGLSLGSLLRKPLADNRELMDVVSQSHMIPIRGFSRSVLLTQSLFDQNVIVPLSLRYLNDARAADSRVSARTYLVLNDQQADALSDNDIRAFVSRLLYR